MDPRRARGRLAVDAKPARKRLEFAASALLAAEFSLVSFGFYVPRAFQGAAGVDAANYWIAANRWLSGGDPYANLGGLVFAAPPPTIAALAPFALLPLAAFQLLLMVSSVAAMVFLVRRLGLPFWFALFPPAVEAVVAGNPNVIVVALLVAAIPASDAVASMLKLYAVLPVVLLGRTRSLLLVGILLAVTAPLLPWVTYLGHGLEQLEVLSVQASGGRSALAYPVLVPFTVAALVVLGRKRAAWLIVPALWPATQFHYSVLAMPAIGRLSAAIMAIPIPGAPAVAVIVDAAMSWAARRRTPSTGAATDSDRLDARMTGDTVP